jgi:hypothetical protein
MLMSKIRLHFVSRLLFLKFTSGMLASCVNYNAFQHLCQQLSEILFVVFLQRFEVTLFANLFLL